MFYQEHVQVISKWCDALIRKVEVCRSRPYTCIPHGCPARNVGIARGSAVTSEICRNKGHHESVAYSEHFGEPTLVRADIGLGDVSNVLETRLRIEMNIIHLGGWLREWIRIPDHRPGTRKDLSQR